ncbi:MAG: nucleoside monophosphate kinase [Candidatus Brennerbacteria bacterium]|nr:nucleoside monophosphate kinase [Candidatus Brennerbacteria bacterium]
MVKQAVIIYGPPGSGKGTQADLLARKYGFIHFDTGRHIESVVHDPARQKDSIIRRERKLFDTGILCTPSWVLKIVRDATKRISEAGYNIVYSGSPRTLFEALGDKRNRGLLAELGKLYGRKNVKIIRLKVGSKTSIKRNSNRLVCSVCGLPILAASKLKNCSFCSGPARRRTLDKPEVIKIRLKEYEERTLPIVKEAKKTGIKVMEINGEPVPYKVHGEAVKKLGLR